jgi:hypothetical protein
LVTSALGMAIHNRQPTGTIIHSDHGTQGNLQVGLSPAESRNLGLSHRWVPLVIASITR